MTGEQNILISGANGYLGSHITELLKHSGHNIYALCLELFEEQKRWEEQGITIIQGDITQSSCLKKLDEYSIDTIIHLVSLNHFDSEKDTELALKVNVLPTWNLLKYFSGKGLKKFIYFSTQQVYGRIPPVNIDELYPPEPVNSYGLTHLQSEQIVNMYNQTTNMEAINVRLSNSYGTPVFKQNSCWWLVVNDLCKTAYEKREIRILSDGSPQRDFIHVLDVAEAVKVLVEKENIENNVFNISSGVTYTILELAILVKQIYEERYTTKIDILGPGNIKLCFNESDKCQPKYTIDSYRLRSLGFQPLVNLESGINQLFEYIEQRG